MYSISQSNKVVNFPWGSTANLFIFAYQVSDLPSGIHSIIINHYVKYFTLLIDYFYYFAGVYVLVRNKEDLEEIKKTTADQGFAWTIPPNVSSLPLCIFLIIVYSFL